MMHADLQGGPHDHTTAATAITLREAAKPALPVYPSGIQLGTPALTTRGMKGPEMGTIGRPIAGVIKKDIGARTARGQGCGVAYLANFRKEAGSDSAVMEYRKAIDDIYTRFPLHPELGLRFALASLRHNAHL
jgi:glycine/serine hydroxymethyltransferase